MLNRFFLSSRLNTTMADILARLRVSPQTTPYTPPKPVAKSEKATLSQTNNAYNPPTSQNRSSPFQSLYVRGLGPPEVQIQNQSNKIISISLDGPAKYSLNLSPQESVKKVLKSGTYSYNASAIGVIPTSGTETFMTDYRYMWTFMIVSYPSIPNIRIPSR
jgi:hypothetical protein